MSSIQRFRVIGGTHVPEAPLDLARHVVAHCAEGSVTFHASLETSRRDVVAALAPRMPADTADVSTVSEVGHPREVPLADEGLSIVFVEQRGAVPGLSQLWLTLAAEEDGPGGSTSLHMRLSRRDPLGPVAVAERLRACRDAGVIPRDADLDAALASVLAPEVSPEKPGRVELGNGHLLTQVFFEGSGEALVSLQYPVREVAGALVMADIWVHGAPILLRRFGSPEAALRAPNVATYGIHLREDGPLTDALLEAREPSERLLVEWEVSSPEGLHSVALECERTPPEVEVGVHGYVDSNYGPDPLDLVEWIAREAGVQLEYLHSA